MKMDGAKSTRTSWMNECTEFGLNECERRLGTKKECICDRRIERGKTC